MDRETRPLAEMDDEQIRKIRMVVFDIDGVIIPKGTDLHENMDGTEFSMKTHKLSPKFVDDVVELKKHVRVAFSSGRNLLYLRSLVNHFFDNRIILQTENGAISFLDGKITHPDYPQEYFEAIHKIKVLVNKNSKEITLRGFEPKMFNLTVHAEVEKDLIYDLVRQSDPTGLVYCIWTGEAFDLGLKGITKGWRLEQTAKQLGMKRDEIVTTGNALNDKEMLEFGVGVTVEPGVVWGAYKTSGKGLGGEELADFLVKRFKELR
ncbi:MAG: HAD family phosphatase [Candidatus Micrarchaeota archaeon]|nr:HAD family phosphatase [Candidatus Micrarchaeota archaeon]